MVHFGIGWLYGYASYSLFGSGSSGLGHSTHRDLNGTLQGATVVRSGMAADWEFPTQYAVRDASFNERRFPTDIRRA